jgi:aquaporin Z
MQKPVTARELICEFIGTLALLFVVVGVSAANNAVGGAIGTVGAALAIGFTIAIFATACMPISGGQFNPAVTLGLLAAQKITPFKAFTYILAQLGGATAGAFLANAIMSPPMGKAIITAAIPAMAPGLHPGQGYLCEIVLTFFLMFAIYGTAVSKRVVQETGALYIGLVVTICIIAGSHVSNSVMNPAVYFGISAASGNFLTDGALIFTIGPIVGSLVAAALWAYVLED